VAQELFSLEQVAAQLGLHVRTVRGYVRDGRLRAVRIGKQYRVSAADLAAFTGRRPPTPPPAAAAGPVRAEVSAVVHVEPLSDEQADRLRTAVLGALAGRDGGDGPLRAEFLHEPDRARLTVVVLGAAAAGAEVVRMVGVLAEGMAG
jgi:excisionase family DNA binding protein